MVCLFLRRGRSQTGGPAAGDAGAGLEPARRGEPRPAAPELSDRKSTSGEGGGEPRTTRERGWSQRWQLGRLQRHEAEIARALELLAVLRLQAHGGKSAEAVLRRSNIDKKVRDRARSHTSERSTRSTHTS